MSKNQKKTPKPAAAPAVPKLPKNGKILLIVEDEDAMAKVLCNKFERQGFEAMRAANGTEALKKMSNHEFDLILLDLLMPGKDGFAVLQERKKTKNAKTPIFVLTNYGEEETHRKAKSLGAIECFTKSNTSLNDLVARVKQEVGL